MNHIMFLKLNELNKMQFIIDQFNPTNLCRLNIVILSLNTMKNCLHKIFTTM